MRVVPWQPGDERLRVAHVIEGSPAEESGIQVGDEIRQIDGRPVAQLEPGEEKELWERPPGAQLTLLVRRGTEDVEIRLTARELI